MLEKLKRHPSAKAQIKFIPETPGIYVFWDKKTPIYIGKAINLKRRLDSYFSKTLLEKTRQMVEESKTLSYIEVPSEMEALLLEAELVWKHKPKFNRALKDDKHPLYIMITKDKYPRIIAAKRSELTISHRKIFGPFPSSGNIRFVLRLLRPIFQYSNHLPTKRPCIYSQMGLCNPCPSLIENTKDVSLQKYLRKIYFENIKLIGGVLSGRIKKVRNDLRKQMDNFSEKQEFEKAKEIREKINRLDYITSQHASIDRFVENPNLIEDIRRAELSDLKSILEKYLKLSSVRRIECFDIAHIAGSHPAASMVTFIDGEADKSLYRHYKIKPKRGGDDIASLTEVASRRTKRFSDWGKPDLIIVDGGKGQSKVFFEEFNKHDIPVVGIAKRFETLVIPKYGEKLEYFQVRPSGPALNLVTRIRDEAHRFARRYHHKLLQKYLTDIT